MATTVSSRARMMWCMRLHSALRTALACAIVGGATIYGPKFLVKEIKFTAFSYLTAVLMVSDAGLGDTLRGCWHAFCATVQVVPLSMLARWMINPADGLPVGTAAVAVAVAAFLVALPEWTHLTAKRIAFGQIVLVCSDAVVSGGGDGFMRPVYVASSTALGALASLVAFLLPYPDLAYYKVQKLCGVYAENASERMNLYLRAFTSHTNLTKMELISQAKPLTDTGTKLQQSIRIFQDGIRWERPLTQYSKHDSISLEERLRRVELPMRGIEYSLVSSPGFPVRVNDKEQLSSVLRGVSTHFQEKIEQVARFIPFCSTTEQETRGESKEKPFLPLEPDSLGHKHEWVFFFFSCINMLLNDTFAAPEDLQNRHKKTKSSINRTFKTWVLKFSKRMEFAFKCSLSLGLAMLFGLAFDKENGCWAGLTIAISFVTSRQAVFTIANTRAQGTAIGSVYGVICCFLFHYEEFRLLALLPWIIFTSFLRHSKMYGQTGGISAAIGALLILGRKNYGLPNEFAIARLTEVFIGLSSFVLVELFLQPTRAATLAKNHLRITLRCLQDCIKETAFCIAQNNKEVTKFLQFREKQRNFRSQVCELRKFIEDAETEPNFWYLPFRTNCYQKVVQSLSNIADMLYLISYNFEILSELTETSNIKKEFQEQMNSELEIYRETLSSSMSYLENGYPSSSSEADSDEKFRDLEAGNPESPTSVLITEDIEEKTITEDEDCHHHEKKLNQRMVQCVGAIGFCTTSLRKEIDEIQIYIQEIDR